MDMTDLEITRACAEAMGYTHDGELADGAIWVLDGKVSRVFNPLHDDAQAMQLVKRFDLFISRDDEDGPWWCSLRGDGETISAADDLNRAICQCVAQMHRRSA